jgi:hypothetical protein
MLFNHLTLVIYILATNFVRDAYANRGNPIPCGAPFCATNNVATLADGRPTPTSSAADAIIALPLRA